MTLFPDKYYDVLGDLKSMNIVVHDPNKDKLSQVFVSFLRLCQHVFGQFNGETTI